MRARDPVVRLLEKVAEGPGGCWIWLAGCDDGGYARLKVYGRAALAHRVSYEAFVGPIPEGMELDHLCRNRACVNPWHLEPVPHPINVYRGISPAAMHRRKTHCLRNHDLTLAHIDPHGRRVCMACVHERRAA